MLEMEFRQEDYVGKIVELIKGDADDSGLRKTLKDFHDRDIAQALALLNRQQRKKLYDAMGQKRTGDVFSYLKENIESFISEIGLDEAAAILEKMDTDDAVDLLEQLDASLQSKLLEKMNGKVGDEIRMIRSFPSDELGSLMTTNYIRLNLFHTIKEAMKELVRQSDANDNIDMLYVVDDDNHYCGAIDLRDLIRARDDDSFVNLIITSYPVVFGHDKIADTLKEIREYSENSLPVLDEDQHRLGVITSTDIIETVDEEISDDYAKLGGLSCEEDLSLCLKA